MTEIVLASESAARRRMLEAAGVRLTVDPAAIDEGRMKGAFRSDGRTADECAVGLAVAKADVVAPRHPGALVIGADQILECDGVWFDKPRDLDEARVQLRRLRGRTHDLVSAVAVSRRKGPAWRHVERARLVMRSFGDVFLERYMMAMGDELLRSVGGYALEGLGAQLFERVEGDYFTILGLPLLPLLRHLRSQGALGE